MAEQEEKGEDPDEVADEVLAGIARWKAEDEARYERERAERGLREPVNARAYDSDAKVLNIGEIVPIGQRTPKDPYLGDTIKNIMEKAVSLDGSGSSRRRKRTATPNALSKALSRISRYVQLTQEEK